MDDSVKFDLIMEIGQRILFIGSTPVMQVFNILLMEQAEKLPSDSAMVSLIDPERYTGGNHPADMQEVKTLIELWTTTPGKFLTVDDAKNAINMGFAMLGVFWDAQHQGMKRAKAGIVTMGVVMGVGLVVAVAVSPLAALVAPVGIAGIFHALTQDYGDRTQCQAVYEKTLNMLAIGAGQEVTI